MKIDVFSIPDEGREFVYQEDPVALHLSPDLELKGRVSINGFLYKIGRTVVVKGTIEAEPHLECGRCSIGFFLPLSIAFDQVFVPKTQTRDTHHRNQEEKKVGRFSENGRSEMSDAEEDGAFDALNKNFYESSSLSLDEMIREQIFLALPMRPLCTPDCKGLCPICRIDLNHFSCNCPREQDGELRIMRNHFNEEMKGKRGE